MPPELRGERLTLRAPTHADLPWLAAFANDETIRGWLRFERPIPVESERAWLEALDDDRDRVWLMTEGGEPLGTIALLEWHHAPRVAELGLAIRRAQDRGRGVGAEAMRLVLAHAFVEMGLQRVWLTVHDDNPARRLYARLGFREEGRLRRHVWKRGSHHDLVAMGLLREEWQP